MRIRSAPSLLLALSLLGGLAAPAAWSAEAKASHPASAAAPGAAKEAVDVNTASETELLAVPGIGKSLAQRIVDFREKNGPFQRVDDLLKVQGIGEKSLQKLRPHVTVSKAR